MLEVGKGVYLLHRVQFNITDRSRSAEYTNRVTLTGEKRGLDIVDDLQSVLGPSSYVRLDHSHVTPFLQDPVM